MERKDIPRGLKRQYLIHNEPTGDATILMDLEHPDLLQGAPQSLERIFDLVLWH